LTGVKRTETGFEFSWQSLNPTQYPAYVHIGQPPDIGADGIMFGFYESPHLADTPITPAGGDGTWTMTVPAPKDVPGSYILLPVETQQEKLLRRPRAGYHRHVALAIGFIGQLYVHR
jgi:hypothetical protein